MPLAFGGTRPKLTQAVSARKRSNCVPVDRARRSAAAMFSATSAGLVAPKSTLDTRSPRQSKRNGEPRPAWCPFRRQALAGPVQHVGTARAHAVPMRHARRRGRNRRAARASDRQWPGRRTSHSTRRRRVRTTRPHRHLTSRERRLQAGSRRIRDVRGCREVAHRTAAARRVPSAIAAARVAGTGLTDCSDEESSCSHRPRPIRQVLRQSAEFYAHT